jgi:hypothetical protein
MAFLCPSCEYQPSELDGCPNVGFFGSWGGVLLPDRQIFCPETSAGGHAKGAGSEIPLSVPAVNETIGRALAAEDYFTNGQKSAVQKDNNRYF